MAATLMGAYWGPEELSARMMLYRGMREDAEGLPWCGSSARTLGVRVPDDIAPDPDGRVRPGTGGMSVAPGDPLHLRPHRRPRAYGGTGADPVFFIQADSIGPALTVRCDRRDHALVEPGDVVELAFYILALHQTRPMWTKLP